MIFSKLLKILLWILFITYVSVLFKYLVSDRLQYRMFSGRIYNFHPFNSIRPYILHKESYNFNTWALNLFGNMIMLVPFGILMPLLFAKLRKTGVFISSLILFNLGIEIVQYYTRLGSFDVDDLILNSLGALIAYTMLRAVLSMRFLKKFSKPM